MSTRLDAIAKARANYVMKKTVLEHELRKRLEDELAAAQTQLDIAVRLAYDAGETKAAIGRAMNTKDYGTINAALKRTEGVEEIVGVNPLDAVYSYNESNGVLSVKYLAHGTEAITGDAEFTITEVDGLPMLSAVTPLYSDDFTVRNDVVRVLDSKLDGEYYEEFAAWFAEKGGL